MKAPPVFYRAQDVADQLSVSKGQGYKVIKALNEELEKKGFLTYPGRVSRTYFNERYGITKGGAA